MDSLLKEVSFSMDEKQVEIKANTYIQIKNSVESIIQRHCNDVKRWKANITDDQKQLPYYIGLQKCTSILLNRDLLLALLPALRKVPRL